MTLLPKSASFYLALCFFLLSSVLAPEAQAVDRRGRLGVGLSNQLKTDIPAVSFKLQRSLRTSFGGMAGVSTADDGGYGAGLKLYRHFFEEPHLIFYGALFGAYLNDKRGKGVPEVTGFQFDFTLGSEFHFQGLKSLGFHFEFGVSLNKLDDFIVETVGDRFLVMGVHFYL